MANLMTPISIKSVEFKNRIGLSPMCQYSSNTGKNLPWHFIHLGTRAVGGFGIIMTEATAISPEGRISPQDSGLWEQGHIMPFKESNDFIKSQGAIPGIQLAHAGRKGSTAQPWNGGQHLDSHEGGWDIIGPSPLPFGQYLWKTPKEAAHEDIKEIVNSFRKSTEYAIQAGFQLLEIHAAHGYLLHSFYSPLTNHRTDEYGGNFNNRIRLLLEVVTEVKSVWPNHFPLAVRLSCSDWIEGGWSINDSIELAKILKTYDVDIIDCSSGFATPESVIPYGPGFQVTFSEQIKKNANIKTVAVGGITDPKQADSIIQNQQADFVFLGREALRDPYWPLRAAKELEKAEQNIAPVQYTRAWS